MFKKLKWRISDVNNMTFLYVIERDTSSSFWFFSSFFVW